MKILVLHGHLSMGGEERVLLNVLRNLVELNYDVDLLITWNHKENNLFENEIPKKVNYEFLFDSYNGKNKLIKEIYRIKAKTTYLKKIEKKIKNEKYDIVIDYSSNLLKYDNFDIKIPVFAWIHFSLTFGEKLTLEKIKKYKKQYKKYSKIFAITRVMKEEFINKVGIDEKKVELVYNPIDLKLIEKNSRLTTEEIATLLAIEPDEVQRRIKELEEQKVICGYHTLINWEKTDDVNVSAVIELKVNPQRGMGFDRIAEKIYHFPEVEDLYLMSGGYDFMVKLKKAPMRDIAAFVSSRLSVIEEVQSTTTHVVLKQYKDHGTMFVGKSGDKRMVVTP